MGSFLLLLFLFVTWFVYIIASAAQQAVARTRQGKPTGGVSVFPAIPVFPLFFWGLSFIKHPWGLYLVGLAHICLLVSLLSSIVWYSWQLHAMGFWKKK